MIALCPSCWHVVEPSARRCHECGADLRSLDDRGYREKLVAALEHPDAATVMRAAAILGERRDGDTVEALTIALRRHWNEPYIAAAIVRALGRFDDDRARECVDAALGHESFIVRKEAAVALQQSPAGRQGR